MASAKSGLWATMVAEKDGVLTKEAAESSDEM